MTHNPANNNCPINADSRNESCACGSEDGAIITIKLSVDEAKMLRVMLTEASDQITQSMSVAELINNPVYLSMFTMMRKVMIQCPEVTT